MSQAFYKRHLVLATALLLIIISGCINDTRPDKKPPGGTEDRWAAIRSSDVARVSGEWQQPVWLGINSEGWEDGAYISGDGKELYFVYISKDLMSGKDAGINRDNTGICKPACGQFPRVDLFYSKQGAEGWQAPVPHPLTRDYPVGGMMISGNTAYFHMEKDDGLETEIYYSRDGKEKIKIQALSSPYKDDDPHVSGNELLFWSDRPASLGGNNIYASAFDGSSWQAPAMMPEPINGDANDMQPFLYGDTLYFTSDRDGKPKIYKSNKDGDTWSAPEIAIESSFAVGEPTLTDDGNSLFFIQMFSASDGAKNPDIMYARRK